MVKLRGTSEKDREKGKVFDHKRGIRFVGLMKIDDYARRVSAVLVSAVILTVLVTVLFIILRTTILLQPLSY